MTQSLFSLLGRVCLAQIFIIAGVNKLMEQEKTITYMVEHGLPYADTGIWLAIVLEILGGFLILVGWRTRFFAFLLAGFVIIVSVVFHNFWDINETAEQIIQMQLFFKNIAILGGLFYIMAFGSGKLSIDRR